MSRHRNVRSLNYEDEYYDDDDVYGHSVEDNYCISPGTAAQFTFNRDRNVDLANYMGHEAGIPEEGEEDYAEYDEDTPRSEHRSSLDYTRPQLNDVDQAKLNSCLEEVRNVVGDTMPENIMVDTIMKHNFSLESSLNELLSHQEKPKPQREPRKNRRNRSQDNELSEVKQKIKKKIKDIEGLVQNYGTQAAADTKLPDRPPEVKGPTIILKTPTPKKTVDDSSKALSQVSIGDQSQNQSKTDQRTTKVNQSDSSIDRLSVVNKKFSESVETNDKYKIDAVDSSKSKDSSQKPSGGTEDGASLEKSDTLSTPKKERYIPPLPRSASKSKAEKYDLKAEYEKRKGGKDMINMVVIGHVDAGKSTLMGHLLYQLGNVNQRAMHKYEQESKKLGKSSFAYAWVLDETEEERTRGVTMDIAQTKFETPHKIITLLDAPGHKDFIPNMITGTAQADVGILVVNATKGEFETGFESGGQTREHALLARSLGVSQLIVAVNKMDTTGWNPDRYDEIVRKLGQFLKQAGYKEADTAFIPVSGLAGVNLVKPVQVAELQAWYKGNTLVEQIDKFKPVLRPVEKPLRFMVSDVFKGMSGGLTLAGKVGSGGIQMGDRVIVMPDAEYGVVKGIGINDSGVNFAFAGDHANVVLTGVDITNVGVGSVLCDMTNPIVCATRIQAKIVLFNLEIPMTRGFTVVFHYQSVTEPAIVKKLVSTINKSTGEVIKNKPKCLTKNSSAVVELEFERPVCLELYKDNKELGRFMLRYSGHTIAAGLVEEILKTKVSGDGTETQGATAM